MVGLYGNPDEAKVVGEGRGWAVDGFEEDFEVDSVTGRELVELQQKRGEVVVEGGSSKDPGNGILDQLELMDGLTGRLERRGLQKSLQLLWRLWSRSEAVDVTEVKTC